MTLFTHHVYFHFRICESRYARPQTKSNTWLWGSNQIASFPIKYPSQKLSVIVVLSWWSKYAISGVETGIPAAAESSHLFN